jgi:hypothetical protein
MFWDLYQEGRIYAVDSKAERAVSKAERMREEIAVLRRAVDRLTLASQAMWELVRELPGFSEERLMARVLEIDLRDGTGDGRITMQTLDCPSCGAKTNSKRRSCLMCGAEFVKPHAFES